MSLEQATLLGHDETRSPHPEGDVRAAELQIFQREAGESLLMTPVDELTRLPLPIVPPRSFDDPDWHHHMHPRPNLTTGHPQTLMDVGGIAVRNSRLQLVERHTHDQQYHRIFRGPPLPKTLEDQLALLIMCLAGTVPPHGLQFSGKKAEVVRLTEDQYRLLRETGQLRMVGETYAHNFLKANVLSQDISELNVSEHLLDEFMHTGDARRRREIGHDLLSLITDKISEPAHETYSKARKKGLILPGLPNSARRFAKSLLGPMPMRDRLVRRLQGRLTAA